MNFLPASLSSLRTSESSLRAELMVLIHSLNLCS